MSETIISIAPTRKARTIAASVVATSDQGKDRRSRSGPGLSGWVLSGGLRRLVRPARVSIAFIDSIPVATAASSAGVLLGWVVTDGGHRLLGRHTGHHQTEHLAGGVRRHDADDLAAVHHRDPVGQRRDLVQLGGHDQHGGAPVALSDQPLVQELDRADIEFLHRRLVVERDRGTAVMIISTELDEVAALADRVAVMYRGKIVGVVPPDTSREVLGLMMAGVPTDEALANASVTTQAEEDAALDAAVEGDHR